MSTWVEWFRQRRAKLRTEFKRGFLPHVSVSTHLPLAQALGGGVFAGAVVWLITWLILSYFNVHDAVNKGFLIGNIALLAFWLLPFLVILITALIYRHWPYWGLWREFPSTQRWVACATLAFFLTALLDEQAIPLQQAWFNYVVPHLPDSIAHLLPKNAHKATHGTKFRHFFTVQEFFLYYWPLLTVGIFGWMHWLSRQRKEKVNLSKPKALPRNAPLPFSLWLGESTGWLAELWHAANIAGRQQMGLTLEDAAQNIVVLGAIGSGKTTRAMHPLLIQLLDQDCGGLIFDIKGDFKKAVFACAEWVGRSITVIGVGQQPLNLLVGLTPEMAASFLKSALLLGGGSKLDSFWTDTATELCRNVLGILHFLPAYYHLNGLYRYLFDKPFQAELNETLQLKGLEPGEKRRLETYQHYLTVIFGQFDEKVQTGVLASVAQILSPFQHPDLVDTFCATDKQAYHMETVLEGTLYLVDMPLSQWGVAGKVVYTLIKLRFFNVMQQRAIRNDWNQARPVFFMCDEYQEIVSCNKDGLSDLNFWDKSRSSKTIGIISAQSVSSFYAAIGDRDLTHALLQNFRQKLVFRVEDDWTISYCNRLLGRVETREVIQSSNAGTSSGGSHTSSGESVSIQHKDVIDGQLFRNMGADQVLALLSLQGVAADDVLNVAAVFL